MELLAKFLWGSQELFYMINRLMASKKERKKERKKESRKEKRKKERKKERKCLFFIYSYLQHDYD
jgi:hypothetical protein